MKILFYALHYGPDPGGAGPFNWQLGTYLAQRGHDVTVISTPPHYPQWRVADEYVGAGHVVEQLDDVTVHRVPIKVPSADELSAKRRIIYETRFNVSALRCWLPTAVRRGRFDLVLSVCPPLQAAVPALAYSRLRRTPFVFFLHDLQVGQAVDLKMITNPRAIRALFRIEDAVLNAATRVAVHTEAMRRQVIDKGIEPDHVWLLPTWADLDELAPSPRENAFRAELDIDPEAVLVTYAGGMGEKHGLDVVVDAARLLRDRSDIQFALIGAGPKRAGLEQQARALDVPNLRFLPLQPIQRMPEILAASDLLLVTGRGDAVDRGFPAKLTNIMAAGRASVAVAAPGTAVFDVLTQHDAGSVVAPDDPAALAAAIAAAADDEELRTRHGRNARTYAEQHLSRDLLLGGFEQQLASLVAAGRRSSS